MKLLTLSRAWLTVAVLAFFAMPAVTYAADALPVNPTDTLASVRLSAVTMSFIVGAVLPLIVGLFTNVRDSAFFKGAALLVLNALAAFITQATLADGSAVFSKAAVMLFVVGTATSLVAYYNAWKPLKATSSAIPVRQVDGTVITMPGNLSTSGLRKAA